jgi:hypothetical protein
MQIHGTGVTLRLTSAEEARALADRDATALAAGGSFTVSWPDRPTTGAAVDVVVHAFVEYEHDGAQGTAAGPRHYGARVATDADPTFALLELARAPDLIDLLATLRIAGLGVSRWALLSAPHRIVIAQELDGRLAPRRTG